MSFSSSAWIPPFHPLFYFYHLIFNLFLRCKFPSAHYGTPNSHLLSPSFVLFIFMSLLLLLSPKFPSTVLLSSFINLPFLWLVPLSLVSSFQSFPLPLPLLTSPLPSAWLLPFFLFSRVHVPSLLLSPLLNSFPPSLPPSLSPSCCLSLPAFSGPVFQLRLTRRGSFIFGCVCLTRRNDASCRDAS